MTDPTPWSQVRAAHPEFCAQLEARFAAHGHKTLATLRRDGSPRITGSEMELVGGEWYFGSMPGARRVTDLRRDPRIAAHSGSDEPAQWRGDAKLSGRAVEITDDEETARYLAALAQQPPPGPFHLHRLEINEAVHVGLDESGAQLVVTSWHPGRGLTRVERA